MISIVIPVLNGGDDLRACLDGIARQQVDDDVEVVVIDSGSTDGSAQVAADWGAKVRAIPPAEFNHGGTRNLGAQLAQGETLVFTSQDAWAASDQWLATLVAPVRSRPDVAGVYGRQLPKTGATPPEQYFLTFLYGAERREQRVTHPAGLTMETTLFSNVNSAMLRSVWEAFPFAEDMIMSEDQEWCGRVLLAGYSIVYEPQAAVYHSHNYSLGSAFRRFFDSGVSAERAYMVGGRPSARALRQTAATYAAGEARWLWRTGRRRWLAYSAIYELTKFAGLRLGKRHRVLPRPLKKALTAYPQHWS